MGDAAHDAYDTVKNAVSTAKTFKSLNLKDLPKKVVKNTVLCIGPTKQSYDMYPKIKNLSDNILLLHTGRCRKHFVQYSMFFKSSSIFYGFIF